MASNTLHDYLIQLQQGNLHSELCSLIEQQTSISQPAEILKSEFDYVLKCLIQLRSFNQSQRHFEPTYLRRVVAKFRTAAEVQTLELQILDAILAYGQQKFGFTSAQVPTIIQIHRDKPVVRPDSLLVGNAAWKLRELLQQEVNHPTQPLSTEQHCGKLLLYLFFFVRVESIEEAFYLLTTAPRLFYADGVVYLECKQQGRQCRYILSDSAALLWMQWLNQRPFQAMNRKPSHYINHYLSSLSDWHNSTVGTFKLRVLRKIDYTLRFSPIAFGIYSGYIQSQLLRPSVFVRILTDRCVPESGDHELVNDDLLTVREKQSWQRKLVQDKYYTLKKQLSELADVLTVLRPNHGRSTNGKLQLSRTDLISHFTTWLDKHADGNMPYLWFLIAWARSLIKHGGQMKHSLKPGTIVDYVTTVGIAFLGNFNEYRLHELDAADWIELLNRTSEEVKSPSRKAFVLYFANFLHDSELVVDLPISELDIATSKGKVDANLISVNHAEAILSSLLKRQDLVSINAHLLFCLCFFSGLRRNEAAYLQLSDLDFSVDEPRANSYDYADLYIRRNQKRGLKSTAANRVLPLDALWPPMHLSKLRARVQYLRATTHRSTTSLFSSSQETEQAYRLITDLMHHYTGDRTLKIHHLRHSFANWTWFRLNAELTKIARKQLAIFHVPYFSEDSLQHFYERLGIRENSRKGMFVLCHLLGHEAPATTIGSYLHLKDVAGYLALGGQEQASKKLLSHTLGRSTLFARQGISENLAERLEFETQTQARKLSPIEPPELATSTLASNKSLQGCFNNAIPKKTLKVLDWASILMACREYSPEQVAFNEGIPPAQVRTLLDHATTVQKHCPRRGKRLPLIPALSPWITQLVMDRHSSSQVLTYPTSIQLPTANADPSGTQKNSHSLQILTFLFGKLQCALDQGTLTWKIIQEGCQILKYLVPGKGYLIRSPSSLRVKQFLTLCGIIGFKSRHIRLTLQLPDFDSTRKKQVRLKWNNLLQHTGVTGLEISEGDPKDWQFLPKHDGLGVMEIRLLNTKLGANGRRQRAFLSMMQFMLILSAAYGSFDRHA